MHMHAENKFGGGDDFAEQSESSEPSAPINPQVGDFNDTHPTPLLEQYKPFLSLANVMPRGTPQTYGATPLSTNPETYLRQMQLLDSMEHLVDEDLPDDVPEKIKVFIKDTFGARFHSRGVANHENYLQSLNSKDDFAHEPEVYAMIERAEGGEASPLELLIVRSILGIRSAELACVSHPYGKRIDELDIMRDAVKQSVEMLGGTYYDEPVVRYRVKGLVAQREPELGDMMRNEILQDCTDGLLMTRKRTVGQMPDGTIIRERTSFILRIKDNPLIPERVIKLLSEFDISQPDWRSKVRDVAQLDEAAAILMDADIFDLVIPVSSTIYAFNTETAAEISNRQALQNSLRRQEERRDMLKNHPVLYAASNAAEVVRSDGRVIKNIGDMLYLGYDDPLDEDGQ